MQGRGNPGEHFGQFYCFGCLSVRPWREQHRVLITLSKPDTDTIMSDVRNIHHTASQWIERSVQKEAAKMGCRAVSQ